MNRPDIQEKCAGCQHTFGQHYETYDGSKIGCSFYSDSQRDGGPCDCKGFTMAWKSNMNSPFLLHPNSPGVRRMDQNKYYER